jgi:hypothetical protein
MHGAIWRYGAGPAHVWWTAKPAVQEQEMGDAIASFNGLSAGTAHHVPGMLLAGTGGPFRELGSEPVNERETADG